MRCEAVCGATGPGAIGHRDVARGDSGRGGAGRGRAICPCMGKWPVPSLGVVFCHVLVVRFVPELSILTRTLP